ncbi:MAG: hypothetical protein MRY21_02215 [Simkaniaceae bacterium]|nr:hypothetical protein [Simkaniaceae bacterium]
MRYLFSVLIFPTILFSDLKEDILQDFTKSFTLLDLREAHESLQKWEEIDNVDEHIVNSCRAFLYLIEGRSHDATRLFEESIHFVSLEYEKIQHLRKIFYENLDYFSLSNVAINYKISDVVLCKKAWKIKAVIGAVMVGVGTLVAVVSPGVGVGIITTGTGLLIDGTAESIDEYDRLKELNRSEAENDNAAFLIPEDWNRRSIMVVI